MFYHAKNGRVKAGGSYMEYICFGDGQRDLIMLPGLGDGLKTVRGTAAAFAVMYKIFARKYKVYVFSRKNDLPEGCSTRDMAADTKEAMDALHIGKADVLGISQGGMIAQYLAIDYPAAVHRLVLAVTLSRPNDEVRSAVGGWLAFAEAGDYRSLLIDTAERSYTEAHLKRYRPLYPLITRIGKPKDFSRFMIQAKACVSHNAYGELDKIMCPTLVIGAGQDKIAGVDASREMAEKIKNSRIYIYPDLGHGAYEEAGDFNRRALAFLAEEEGIRQMAD